MVILSVGNSMDFFAMYGASMQAMGHFCRSVYRILQMDSRSGPQKSEEEL